MNGVPTFWFDGNESHIGLVIEVQTIKGNPLAQTVGIAFDHGTEFDIQQVHALVSAVAKLIAPAVHLLPSRQISAAPLN